MYSARKPQGTKGNALEVKPITVKIPSYKVNPSNPNAAQAFVKGFNKQITKRIHVK